MAKKVMTQIKLQIKAGQANPAPPVGPALGQHGLNIMEFCNAFNERTKEQMGLVIPVVITVFQDRSFSFITKTPPASVLIKKAIGLDSGSTEPGRISAGTITRAQLREIAETEDGGPECRFARGRDEDHRRHRAEHGTGSRLDRTDCEDTAPGLLSGGRPAPEKGTAGRTAADGTRSNHHSQLENNPMKHGKAYNKAREQFDRHEGISASAKPWKSWAPSPRPNSTRRWTWRSG